MNLKAYLIFMVFILFFQSVYSQEVYEVFNEIEVEIDSTIQFEIEKESDFKVNKLDLISYFYPQTSDRSQDLLEFTSNMDNYEIVKDDDIELVYYDFSKGNINEKTLIENKYNLKSYLNKPESYTKVRYPLVYIGSNHEKYLQFGEFTNIDSNIKSQASKLAEGEDDIYLIASKVAKWIREDIEYDLTTLAENPNQDSVEVFKSKKGVCREITNLYVSMMRSLGIPARIVTGYAYTNSDDIIGIFGSNWGGHAWAEVLVGDKWVPFDLTYDQYGFVDAGHIVLDKSIEIRNNAVQINGSGYGFNLVKGSLETENEFTVIQEVKGEQSSAFTVEVSGPDELGLGSYGYLQVDVENSERYYQVVFLRLAKTKEIELIDSEDEVMVILKPRETKRLFFRYKLPDLDDGFVYTFPFNVYNEFVNEEIEIEMKGSHLSIKESSLPKDLVEEKDSSNYNLGISCKYDFEDEVDFLSCNFKNINNFEVEDLEVCNSDNSCEVISLKLNDEKIVKFETGDRSIETITYSFNGQSSQFSYNIEKPKLEFTKELETEKLNLKYDIANYNDKLILEIFLNDKLIRNTSNEKESINIGLNEGVNNFKLILKSGDRIFDEQTFITNLEISQKETIKDGEEVEFEESLPTITDNVIVSFISKILSFFKS